MKHWALAGILAAGILGGSASSAEACGGYGEFVDPQVTAVEVAVTDHFARSRRSVRVQQVQLAELHSEVAVARVVYVDRRDARFAQNVRLVLRNQQWRVVGGARPVRA
ncbi:MAG: hypothetical protein AAGE52_26930 [Myxococcota bacterium]